MKPWKISQNFTEKINSSNGAFSGLNNKRLKSLAIRASDCQDLLAQIQRVLAWPEIKRSQFKFRWLCFYEHSSLLNRNKYVYGKCCFSIVISCQYMSLLQYVIVLFSYSKWFQFRKVFLSGPVHTMPDKFENATLLLRIRLPSTPIRIKRSTKTELFENALQSGTI